MAEPPSTESPGSKGLSLLQRSLGGTHRFLRSTKARASLDRQQLDHLASYDDILQGTISFLRSPEGKRNYSIYDIQAISPDLLLVPYSSILRPFVERFLTRNGTGGSAHLLSLILDSSGDHRKQKLWVLIHKERLSVKAVASNSAISCHIVATHWLKRQGAALDRLQSYIQTDQDCEK